ncbi:Fanconi anemia group A protein-like isoform X2 [Schistocerca piceifrons]|uniref:Fanconi anemia group A protein-like isoform X2 n=1 Tax=Schistocerca piceifrons TaxID=274613 RepID=UPI001F5F1FDB|nr:Fanconi anemia group A protein-like isoform X2 [Schistocerca piceifrons]
MLLFFEKCTVIFNFVYFVHVYQNCISTMDKLMDLFEKALEKKRKEEESEEPFQVRLKNCLEMCRSLEGVISMAEAKRDLPDHSIGSVAEALSFLKKFEDDRTSHLYATDVPSTAAVICANAIRKIISTGDEEDLVSNQRDLLNSEKREQCESLITIMKKLVGKSRFNIAGFQNDFNQVDNMPLEALWYFMSAALIPLPVYVLSQSNHMNFVKNFACRLVQLSTVGGDEIQKSERCSEIAASRTQEVVRDMFIALLTSRYCLSEGITPTIKGKQSAEICTQILDALTQQTTALLLQHEKARLPNGDLYQMCLTAPLRSPQAALEQHAGGQLRSLLSALPTHESAEDLEMDDVTMDVEGITEESVRLMYSVIKQQPDWTGSTAPKSLSKFLSAIAKVMNLKDSVAVVNEAILDVKVNWQILLLFVSSLCKDVDLAPDKIKGLVLDTILRSFSETSKYLLGAGLVIARQCCTLSCKHFTSYAEWFGQTFGSEAAQVTPSSTSQPAFEFLMGFLGEIIPVEPAYCLRVHINKVPVSPPNCKILLGDYIQLAKSRLSELNEVPTIGLFGFEMSTDQEIAYVLSSFEETGEVMQTVLNAAVFRSRHFEAEFLPRLLTPRVLPHPPDVRCRFIDQLRSKGKIPSTVYKKYLSDCAALKDNNVPREVLSTENAPELFVQLQEALEDLASSLLMQATDVEAAWSKIALCLENMAAAEEFRNASMCLKVIQLYLEVFVNCMWACSEDSMKKWPKQYVCLLQSFPNLWKLLCNSVIQWCLSEEQLPDHKVRAAAVLLYLIESFGPSFSKLPVEDTAECTTVAQYVADRIPLRDTKDMIHCIRLAEQYMRYAEFTWELKADIDDAATSLCLLQVVPAVLVKKFLFAQQRLDSEKLPPLSWKPSKFWAQFIHNNQMTLNEWLQAEADTATESESAGCRQQRLIMRCSPPDKDTLPNLFNAAITFTDASLESDLVLVLTYVIETNAANVGSSWLLQQWANQKPTEDNRICSIVTRLPPWLIFTSNYSVTPGRQIMQDVAAFITKRLVKSLCDRGFLPSSFTRHILMGLCSACRSSTDKAAEYLSYIIGCCPAFRVALLVHARQVSPTLLTKFPADAKGKYTSLMNLKNLFSTFLLNTGCWEVPSESKLHEMKVDEWEIGLTLWYRGSLSDHRRCNTATCVHLPIEILKWVLLFGVLDVGVHISEGKLPVDLNGPEPHLEIQSKYGHFITELVTLVEQSPAVLQVLDMCWKEQTRNPVQHFPPHVQHLTAVAGVVLFARESVLSRVLKTTDTAGLLCRGLLSCLQRWTADVFTYSTDAEFVCRRTFVNPVVVSRVSGFTHKLVTKISKKFNITVPGSYFSRVRNPQGETL